MSHPSARKPLLSIQMKLDFGQKNLGSRRCVDCGMVYTVGDKEDEKLHSIHHRKLFPCSVRLPRGRHQRILREQFDGGRIVELILSDRVGLSSFERIARIMSYHLGDDKPTIDADPTSQWPPTSVPTIPDNWRVFVYVMDGSQLVIGCLVVEELTQLLIKTNQYQVQPLSNGRKNLLTWTIQNGNRINDLPLPTNDWSKVSWNSRIICGVRRLWVANDQRRKGIATKLLQCVLDKLVYGHPLTRCQVAFSDLTADGADFAVNFVGYENILIY